MRIWAVSRSGARRAARVSDLPPGVPGAAVARKLPTPVEAVAFDVREHHPLEDALFIDELGRREHERPVRLWATDEVPVVPGRVHPRLLPALAVLVPRNGHAQAGESIRREGLEALEDDVAAELDRNAVRPVAVVP